MARIADYIAFLMVTFVSVSASAQIQEQCMDCVEKEIRQYYIDNVQWTETEAQCCDAPCAGGWSVVDENVGWGCLVDTWDNPEFAHTGTHCNSSDRDEGCPEPPPPDDGGTIPCIPGEPGCGSPIILDLGDDNYRLTSPSHGVHFDLRHEGEKVQMAWPKLGAENAFLALDRNGNGQIDNGAELFGNYTPLRDGSLAANGFEALDDLDTNSDRVIDSADPVWTSLLLWTDRNHDGFSSADELQPVAGSTVSFLRTEHRTISKKDQWGNLFHYAAKFGMTKNGREHERTYYDVFFQITQ